MPITQQSNGKAFNKLNLALKTLEGVETKVGWFGSSKYEDGTPVAYVAALNELGHPPTPPRPFMRPTIAKENKKWIEIAAKGAQQVLKGQSTIGDIMETLGLVVESDVLKSIVALQSPPLSPVTIELRAMKKKNPDLKVTGRTVGIAAAKVNTPGYVPPTGVSTKPLNDTGVMIATLTHVVEKAP